MISFDELARKFANRTQRRQFNKLSVATAFSLWSYMSIKTAEASNRLACVCGDPFYGTIYNPDTTCCIDDGVSQYLRRRHPMDAGLLGNDCHDRSPYPPYINVGNGCGPANWLGQLVPDNFGEADFFQICVHHDLCYGTCYPWLTSTKSKSDCDSVFYTELFDKCDTVYPSASFPFLHPACIAAALAYYNAVTYVGGPAFSSAQADACQCCGYSCPSNNCGDGRCPMDYPYCASGDPHPVCCQFPNGVGDCTCPLGYHDCPGTGLCFQNGSGCPQ